MLYDVILFQNLLYMIVLYDCDQCMVPSHVVWQFVTVTYDIMLIPSPKFKIEKKMRIK